MADITTLNNTPELPDGVLSPSDVTPIEEPGCTAYVHYNGPTGQLDTMCAGMAVLAPGASPHPPHQHPEEELLVVASGTGEIEVNGKVTQVGPGSIMYCAAQVMHGVLNTGSTPMTFYWSKWTAKNVSA